MTTTTPYPTQTSHGARDAKASPAFDQAADVGRSAAEGAKEALPEAASSMKGEARKVLNRQVDTGAAYLGHAASSLRTAAGDLSKNAPPFASLAEMAATRLDNYANAVKGKTAEEVWDTAVDFTRHQPALVFAMASLAGFLAYRTFKNTQSSSPSIHSHSPDREFHGE